MLNKIVEIIVSVTILGFWMKGRRPSSNQNQTTASAAQTQTPAQGVNQDCQTDGARRSEERNEPPLSSSLTETGVGGNGFNFGTASDLITPTSTPGITFPPNPGVPQSFPGSTFPPNPGLPQSFHLETGSEPVTSSQGPTSSTVTSASPRSTVIPQNSKPMACISLSTFPLEQPKPLSSHALDTGWVACMSMISGLVLYSTRQEKRS